MTGANKKYIFLVFYKVLAEYFTKRDPVLLCKSNGDVTSIIGEL